MVYNYKDEDNIQEYCYADLDEFVDDILDVYKTLRRYEYISIYARFEEILMIMLKLCKEDFLNEVSNIDNYKPNKMTILTISYDGKFYIEHMLHNNVVLCSSAALTYVYDVDCCYSIANVIDLQENNVLHYIYEGDLK